MNRSAEVQSELRRIAAEHGGILRAADVVQEAASAASPLHSCFEWDDGEAGHLYRLQQARQLIRVTVEVLPYQEESFRVRAFVSLMSDRVLEGGGYRVTAEILSSATGRSRLLEQALKELNALKIKYQNLQELVTVFAAIERVAERQAENGPAPPPPEGPVNDSVVL